MVGKSPGRGDIQGRATTNREDEEGAIDSKPLNPEGSGLSRGKGKSRPPSASWPQETKVTEPKGVTPEAEEKFFSPNPKNLKGTVLMSQPVTILYAGPDRGGLVANLTNHRTIRVLRKYRGKPRVDELLFEELVVKTALALNRKPENVRRALKERFF